MRQSKIIISADDRSRLQNLVNSALLDSRIPRALLDSLEGELARAMIVSEGDVPNDVVVMNSTVTFRDLDSGDVESYTIVYPNEADVSRNQISVLAPVGTALLGYRVGDLVEWGVPAGKSRLRITQVRPRETADAIA